MDYKEFIKPEFLILIPVLYGIGIAIKATPKVKNWMIPFILMGGGVFLVAMYLLATEFTAVGNLIAAYLFASITQGVLAAGGAVLAFQAKKQATVGREIDQAGTKAE